ncbi:MAG TPA: SDR family oxidoreductase [Actinospica sp.]|jgi:NAD(P)-dependent dehydrogenase (short-subunit alcohol dehydrogenase family)|nr:SDR family oxidoreductase [Actinospica sp.]
MTKELSGKVAVVTGGASGLGRATVEKLLSEGARVVFGDVDRERGESLAADCGPEARFRLTDVGDPEQVRALVSYAIEEFDGLHVMVNNAGVSGAMHRGFLDDDFADFHRVVSINLLGAVVGTQQAGRHMARNGGGSIVNLTSTGGILAGPGVTAYRASKAALIHVSKSIAIDLARFGIRVNCVAPGNIPTDLLLSAARSLDGEEADEVTQAIRASMAANQPLRREGTPQDVAEAVLYLAGDRSRHVTGIVLPVDGGTTAGAMPHRARPKTD